MLDLLEKPSSFKVSVMLATSQANISLEKDASWSVLLKLMVVFTILTDLTINKLLTTSRKIEELKVSQELNTTKLKKPSTNLGTI